MSCAPTLRAFSFHERIATESGKVKWRNSWVPKSFSPAFAHLLNPSNIEMANVLRRLQWVVLS